MMCLGMGHLFEAQTELRVDLVDVHYDALRVRGVNESNGVGHSRTKSLDEMSQLLVVESENLSW